jgi:outer membrane receptor protein involved in Fe transport
LHSPGSAILAKLAISTRCLAVSAAHLWVVIRKKGWLSASGSVLSTSLLAPTSGDSPNRPTGQNDSLQEIVVSAPNLAGVVQERDSATTFGIDKPLVDTPRSVTALSDELLDRYNIKTVYDFTAVAAGTYTGSFFGVPGSLNVRGTNADTYFMGFQQITNIATYPTPISASSNIELVRGPASPAYGAGQIGGYMNFIPKSSLGDNEKYASGSDRRGIVDRRQLQSKGSHAGGRHTLRTGRPAGRSLRFRAGGRFRQFLYRPASQESNPAADLQLADWVRTGACPQPRNTSIPPAI